jgi:hypothetical protein
MNLLKKNMELSYQNNTPIALSQNLRSNGLEVFFNFN